MNIKRLYRSTVLKKLCCWPCLLFSNKHSSLNKEGFSNLLSITRSLHKRDDFEEHLKYKLSSSNFEKNQNNTAYINKI